MLDDGRSIAFDLKDYDQIDHGYAATVHKSQGVTIDRVHVLATPGLDRHAAYVALSRHRDSVDLHYGRDDFADQGKLVRALSRERGKDMTSDYVQVPEQDRIAPPPSSRNPFDGLRSNPLSVAPEPAPLDKAVERFARAAVAIFTMRDQGLEELAHQKSAFTDAATALEAVRPHGAHDLRAVMHKDRGVIEQAATGNTSAAIRAMSLESEIRIDTVQRADRFVADWQQKVSGLEKMSQSGDYPAIRRAKDSLGAMADGLHRDPQLESLLRNRTKELGIGQLTGQSLSQELQRHRVLSLGRGLGR